MREHHGPSGRVSTKLKVALAALIAVFAISGLSATQASAAQQLELSFNDSWIGLPALEGLGAGAFHAIDPAKEGAPTVGLNGTLSPDGTFKAPASAFTFPTQEIDAGLMVIKLDIVSREDIVGKYDQVTGAFNADLSLRLDIKAGSDLECQLAPLNIPLATSGSYSFPDEGGPVVKEGTPFANGAGAVLGSWKNVTVDNVTQVPPPEDPEDDACKALIGGIIAGAAEEGEIPSFDGTIWLGGTAAVTGEPDKPVDPEVKKPGKVGKITAPKKGKVKRGKATVIKVKVKNSGGKVLKGKLSVKSSNKQVKAPKKVSFKVPAGKVKVVKVKVKATKKAKGKAKITFKAGGKKAVTKLAVKK